MTTIVEKHNGPPTAVVVEFGPLDVPKAVLDGFSGVDQFRNGPSCAAYVGDGDGDIDYVTLSVQECRLIAKAFTRAAEILEDLHNAE